MNYEELIPVYRIDIKVILEPYTSGIAATDIIPLQPDGEQYDPEALALYDEFIINVLSIFDYYDFVILDEHQSPYSKSEYYTLVKRNQYEAEDYRYVLFIRISDHELREEGRSGTMKYYSDRANKLKMPKSKNKQIWRLKSVIVNNNHFKTYEQALDEIEKRLGSQEN